MELSWLKTFIVAAETNNFRQTAEELFISQPSVTVHIRQLEEYLGVKLFDRINNRVTLTDTGKVFYKEAKQLVEQLEIGVNKARTYAQGFRKNWTIAISPLMAETILPYILRTFINSHPDVEISIRIEESTNIEQLVDSGEVHLGISAIDAKFKNIESIKIYEDPILFIMAPDQYDDETGPPIDVSEVLQNEFVFTDFHPGYWDFLINKLKNHVNRIRTMKVTQAHIVKRFIQEGLGVSFLPHSIVKRELLEGKLMQPHFELFELPTVSTYIIVKKKGKIEEEFIQLISKYYFG